MASEDDFLLSDEQLRVRGLKRRRIFIIVAALVVLLLAGILGGPSAGRQIKAWQARRHAQKAFDFIEHGDWRNAQKEAVAAFRLRPKEPEALRAVARYLSRIRHSDALKLWSQLAAIAPLTREDRRDEAASALAANDLARANTAVSELINSTAPDAADWLLAAEFALQKGVQTDALTFSQKVLDDPRATEPQQLQAAIMQITSATDSINPAQQQAKAWARIERLSHGQSAASLDALIALTRRVISTPSDARDPSFPKPNDLIQALEKHPLAKASHKLLALDAIEHEDPAQRETVIARAIAEWKETDPTALVGWLISKREYQRALDTVPLEKVVQSRELFLEHLDALSLLGRWAEIKQLLLSSRFPLDPVIQQMYLARASAELGEKAATENSWRAAFEATAGKPDKLLTLAEYAQRNGALEIAQDAYDRAAVEAPSMRPAQRGRLQVAAKKGDTKKMQTILGEMLRIWPNDTSLQNDEAYMRLLLLGNSPENAGEAANIEQLALKLIEREPANLPHRTLLALSRLRQGRFPEAIDVYKSIQVPGLAISPSAHVVHAAVFAANGQKEAARAEIKGISLENLLPEERALTGPFETD